MNRRHYRRPRSGGGSWAVNTLAVLAIFGSLYLASELLLPIVLASLLALLLAPVVSWFKRYRIPRVIGAFLVLAALIGTLALGAVLLAEPAANWVERIPEISQRLQQRLSPVTQKVEEMSEAASQVGDMTPGAQDGGEPQVVVNEDGGLRDLLFRHAQALAFSIVVVIFLLFFLLASSERLWRNILHVLPDQTRQRQLRLVMRRMQRQISLYLLTVTAINAGVGVAVFLLALAFGLPNPLLWGVLAGLLNYVPYLGPAATLLVLAVVSFLSLPPAQGLLVPLCFLILTGLEGQLITPLAAGRSLALNPVWIFVGLIFWGWLWGILGVLLAVPIMASFKIVCDNVEPLKPIGVLLQR